MPTDPYMTPGSAVADQLQNILARKALEARQSSQDALNAQNVQSQIAARQSLAEETKARIQGLNADRAARELKDRASLYGPDQDMQPGADLDYFQNTAPNLLDPATQDVPGDEYEGQIIPGHGIRFRGLPGEQDKKRAEDAKIAALRVITDPAQYAKLNPAQRIITAHQAGITIPEKIANPDVAEKPWHPVYSAKGEDTGNWAPEGAHFLPNEPREPVDHGTYVGPATQVDPNDPTKTIEAPGKSFIMRNGKMVVEDNPSGYGIGPKPRAAGANAGKVPPLYGAKEATALLSAYKNKSQAPGAKLARNAAINMFITSISDPKVKADVLQAWTDKDLQDKSLEELQSMLEGDPEHVRKVLEALRASGRQ